MFLGLEIGERLLRFANGLGGQLNTIPDSARAAATTSQPIPHGGEREEEDEEDEEEEGGTSAVFGMRRCSFFISLLTYPVYTFAGLPKVSMPAVACGAALRSSLTTCRHTVSAQAAGVAHEKPRCNNSLLLSFAWLTPAIPLFVHLYLINFRFPAALKHRKPHPPATTCRGHISSCNSRRERFLHISNHQLCDYDGYWASSCSS